MQSEKDELVQLPDAKLFQLTFALRDPVCDFDLKALFSRSKQPTLDIFTSHRLERELGKRGYERDQPEPTETAIETAPSKPAFFVPFLTYKGISAWSFEEYIREAGRAFGQIELDYLAADWG